MTQDNKQSLTAIRPTLTTVKERLKAFVDLNNNTPCIIETKDKEIKITNPWGDKSVTLDIAQDSDIEAIAETLNNVFLPPLYSAIWHKDTHDLEFIFTPMDVKKNDISQRKFTFKNHGKDHVCEYAEASPRLLKIIELADISPVLSTTDCRNIVRFKMHNWLEEQLDKKNDDVKPISFWVRNIAKWDEDEILQIATHLSFYMKYYDTKSPYIGIHYPINENIATKPPQYRKGRFPETIISRNIDDNILHLWHASLKGDAARRFLYSYMIIEYVSTFYMKETAAAHIRDIISAPDLLDDLATASEKIMGAVLESKPDDYDKIPIILKAANVAALVRTETKRNIKAFTEPTDFIGGFALDAIFQDGWNVKEYEKAMSSFCKAIRDIRNALSHATDHRGAVISPTVKNNELLQPWSTLMSVLAEEIILWSRK